MERSRAPRWVPTLITIACGAYAQGCQRTEPTSAASGAAATVNGNGTDGGAGINSGAVGNGQAVADGGAVPDGGVVHKANPPIVPGGGQMVRVVSINSGKVLDVASASQDNGAPLDQWSNTGGDNQLFTFRATPENYLQIINKHSGRCLTAVTVGSPPVSAVQQADCAPGSAAQLWDPRPEGIGIALANASNGQCLNVSQASVADGGQVITWPCATAPNEQWRVDLASAAAPVPGSISTKKGVGTWSFNRTSQALSDTKVSWFYNWASSPSSISVPKGVEYVPMIWGAKDVTSGELNNAKRNGSTLLGFNEPDHADQSELAVEDALNYWPQLMATGLRLGSPALAGNPAAPGSWLEQFMQGVATRGYRVDFICVHWYGGNFDTPTAVESLRQFLLQTYARFNLPVWITEYGLIHWTAITEYPYFRGDYPTDAQQAAFASASVKMMETLPYLERYGWYSLASNGSAGANTYLYGNNGLTTVGQAYQGAGIH